MWSNIAHGCEAGEDEEVRYLYLPSIFHLFDGSIYPYGGGVVTALRLLKYNGVSVCLLIDFALTHSGKDELAGRDM